MARYPLIIKDTTYLILLKRAAAKGLSMGKFLNIILDEYAMREVGESIIKCDVPNCDEAAVVYEHWRIGECPRCEKHRDPTVGFAKIAVEH